MCMSLSQVYVWFLYCLLFTDSFYCLFVCFFLFIYRDYTTVSCIAGNIGKEFRLAIILPYNGTYYCVF